MSFSHIYMSVLSAKACSFSAHPKNAYDSIPATVMAPTITFHAANTLALGRKRVIAQPATRMPIAEKPSVTTPRTKLGE